ncbi:MAG TPA: hypothetical protein VJ276_01155 [Thermoanaerobaculia bacterium]|nr:hypothetical protein [Thermoanaerobaculia bacterium]
MALILTALLFPLAGRALRARTWAEAYLLGVGAVGTALFLLPFEVAVAVIVLLAIAGARASRPYVPAGRDARRLAGGTPARPNAPLIVMLIPLLLMAYIAAITPLSDFDGRAFWLLKAKGFADERQVDGPFFHGEKVYDPRNHYPLLMPLNAGLLMIATGHADDAEVRWLYLGVFVAMLFVIRRRADPWLAAIVAWLPQFAAETDGGALSAYSDVAVAAFVACAVFEEESPLRFGAWLAFLVLTKNEGLPIAIVLLALGAWRFRKRASISAVPAVIATAALIAWRHRIPPGDEENLAALLRTLPEHLDRLWPAITIFAAHLVGFAKWGLFWIAVALTARRRMPIAVMLAIIATYLAAYTVTTWIQRDLINSSADRLLMHLIGPACLAMACHPEQRRL